MAGRDEVLRFDGFCVLLDQGFCRVEQLASVIATLVHVFHPLQLYGAGFAAEVLALGYADGKNLVATVGGCLAASSITRLLCLAQPTRGVNAAVVVDDLL